METLLNIDWKSVFVPTVSILEIIFRGTVVYLALLALNRFVLKRGSGSLGITDLLLIVLIADAAQSAMASDYKSITEGLVLVVTLFFWSYFLDWLGSKYSGFQRFLLPPPLPLIKNGQMIRSNMRSEMVSQDELMSYLRQQGIEEVSEVKTACMEGDGHISVIPKDSAKKQGISNRNEDAS